MLGGEKERERARHTKRAEKTHVCQLQNESTNVHMTHKVGQLNFDKKLKAVKQKKNCQVKVNLQNLQAVKKPTKPNKTCKRKAAHENK